MWIKHLIFNMRLIIRSLTSSCLQFWSFPVMSQKGGILPEKSLKTENPNISTEDFSLKKNLSIEAFGSSVFTLGNFNLSDFSHFV